VQPVQKVYREVRLTRALPVQMVLQVQPDRWVHRVLRQLRDFLEFQFSITCRLGLTRF